MEEDTSSGGVFGYDKPRRGAVLEPTPHLYVANCGSVVGLSLRTIQEAFASFGEVVEIQEAGDSGTRVIISFRKVEHAVAAKAAWSGQPCGLLHGRVMNMQYSVPRPAPTVEDQLPAVTASTDIGIPGLVIYPDFVSIEEEKELLAAVDPLPWLSLAKRRVQHYGYEFLYKSRNVDLSQKLGNLPIFVEQVVERISALPELIQAEELSLPLDQLTVNEYPRGVGLSPHIDTHSAFEGSIISLSLSGPCIMEFRRYWSLSEDSGEISGYKVANSAPSACRKVGLERKALFLPPRSLLILSDESRYAWHHYIPHRKADQVIGEAISRGQRRVSFTFRKVRSGSCHCKFVKDCDSQASELSGFPLLSNAKTMELTDSQKLGARVSYDLTEGEEENVSAEEEGDKNEVHQELQPVIKDMDRGQFDVHQTNPLKPLLSASKSDPVDLPEREIEHKEDNKSDASERTDLSTPDIEKLYVHKVYDAIAPHFSATRFARWPKVALFLDSLAPGSLVADSGCGNGKYLGFNPRCFFIGCDISPRLVAVCAQRGHDALVADALHLPYRTGFYDAAISIAVLHHLSNDQRRKRAIEELVRIVCAGGKILITVWAREQEDEGLVKKWTPISRKYVEDWVSDEDCIHSRRHDLPSSLERIQERDGCMDSGVGNDAGFSIGSDTGNGESRICLKTIVDNEKQQGSGQNGVDRKDTAAKQHQEYFVPWHLPYHRTEVSGASAAAVASGFAKKDDKKGAVVYDRYYHMFAKGELESLATEIQGVKIVARFFDKSNWCIILQKL